MVGGMRKREMHEYYTSIGPSYTYFQLFCIAGLYALTGFLSYKFSLQYLNGDRRPNTVTEFACEHGESMPCQSLSFPAVTVCNLAPELPVEIKECRVRNHGVPVQLAHKDSPTIPTGDCNLTARSDLQPITDRSCLTFNGWSSEQLKDPKPNQQPASLTADRMPITAQSASYENYMYIAINVAVSPSTQQRLPSGEIVETTDVHQPEGVAVFLFDHSGQKSLAYQVNQQENNPRFFISPGYMSMVSMSREMEIFNLTGKNLLEDEKVHTRFTPLISLTTIATQKNVTYDSNLNKIANTVYLKFYYASLTTVRTSEVSSYSVYNLFSDCSAVAGVLTGFVFWAGPSFVVILKNLFAGPWRATSKVFDYIAL